MRAPVINGKYILIKIIGEGGFGKVWLAQDSNNNFFAIKQIQNITPQNHECQGVIRYKKISDKINSPHLIKIFDVAIEEQTLYYVMPLCDGVDTNASEEHFDEFEQENEQHLSPLDDNWKPRTLQSDIDLQRSKNEWFDRNEISEYIKPIINSVNILNEKGFLHRDIKPANIMFFDGNPCLGDIGLLTADTLSVSSVGTPFYLAPKWFIDSHGNPDMWGLAMTLFTLLSGATPELYGRQAYRFPPQGKEKMTTKNIIAWDNYYQIILNATSKDLRERYARISDFAIDVELIATDKFNKPTPDINAQHFDTVLRKYRLRKNIIMGAITLSALGLVFFLGRYSSPAINIPAQKTTYDKTLEYHDNKWTFYKNWRTSKTLIQDFEKLLNQGMYIRNDNPTDENIILQDILTSRLDAPDKRYQLIPILVDYYMKEGNTLRATNILKCLGVIYIDEPSTTEELFELCKFLYKYNYKKIIPNIDYEIQKNLIGKGGGTTNELIEMYHQARKFNLPETMNSIKLLLRKNYISKNSKLNPKDGRLTSRAEMLLLPQQADDFVKELLKEK